MEQLFILLNAEAGQQSPYTGFAMIVILIAIFYFMMIRPQQKKQKEIRKFRDSLKAGVNVISAGGIFGKIKSIIDNYVVLEIASGVTIRIDKGSIYAAPADVPATENNDGKL